MFLHTSWLLLPCLDVCMCVILIIKKKFFLTVPYSMWGLSSLPGIEPALPTLAAQVLTTGLPGKSNNLIILISRFWPTMRVLCTSEGRWFHSQANLIFSQWYIQFHKEIYISFCSELLLRLNYFCESGKHWRRKWQPTPVFLPWEFYGQRSLMAWWATVHGVARVRLSD